MGYTPQIFVDYNELGKVFDEMGVSILNNLDYNNDTLTSDDDIALLRIRKGYLDGKSFTLKGVDVLILYYDLTSGNEDIRDKLNDLGIEYSTYF